MHAAEIEIETTAVSNVLTLEPLLDETERIEPDAGRYVAFYFGESLYCVAAAEVAEVTHPLPVSPLPNGPASLYGISQLRGEIAAIVDLRTLLGERESQSAIRTKFVVLRSAEDDTRVAFPVDRMHEFVSFTDGGSRRQSSSNPFVAFRAAVGDSIVDVVDIQMVKTTLGQ
jgi:chemotaxis signal transduction protein